MESVSSSLSNFWSPLKWRGRQRKRASVWVRVCWRQDSAPCLSGSQSPFQKKKITNTLLWAWEIQELGGSAHMTHLFWNSPDNRPVLLLLAPAQGLRTAGKTAGHPWAGESRHRIEELLQSLNSGTEGHGGDWGLSWLSDWSADGAGWIVCVCCRGGAGAGGGGLKPPASKLRERARWEAGVWARGWHPCPQLTWPYSKPLRVSDLHQEGKILEKQSNCL